VRYVNSRFIYLLTYSTQKATQDKKTKQNNCAELK